MKFNSNEMHKTKDVARYLGASEAIVRYRIRTGKLKARNVNPEGEKPQWRIKGDWIIEYVAKYGKG